MVLPEVLIFLLGLIPIIALIVALVLLVMIYNNTKPKRNTPDNNTT